MDPLRPSSRDPSLPADLEWELGRQILTSEKLRAELQAAMGATIFVIVAIVGGFHLLRGTSLPGYKWALIIAVFAIVYELITRELFDYYLRHDAQPLELGRYLNAAIETSIPTIVIIVFTQTSNPDVALTSAAPFTYYFFIILSALRLDFWLSAFTGLVAALGYSAITIWFLDELLAGIRVPEQMVGYVMRPTFLLLGGIIAGFVAKQIRAGLLRAMRATEERRQVVQMFGQHVSPAVVNQLWPSRPALPLSFVRSAFSSWISATLRLLPRQPRLTPLSAT
jgi:adenylate cyclase